MTSHTAIYKNRPEKYDQLVSKQVSLSPFIEEIICLDGLDIIEIGAGTGRITEILAEKANKVIACDTHEATLRINEQRLIEKGLHNWETHQADVRKLPAADNSADLVVAGWAISYVANSNENNHAENLSAVMAEIKRVLRPGGMALIIETLGTGEETPRPPEKLKFYYRRLEQEYSFNHRWARLDYEFENLAEAKQSICFFFGEKLASQVEEMNWVKVPECAGIWWRQF